MEKNYRNISKIEGWQPPSPGSQPGASSLAKSLGRLTKQSGYCSYLVSWPLHKHLSLTEPEAPLPQLKPPLPLFKRCHHCPLPGSDPAKSTGMAPTASAPKISPTFPPLTLVSSSPISGLSNFTFSLSSSHSLFLCVSHFPWYLDPWFMISHTGLKLKRGLAKETS